MGKDRRRIVITRMMQTAQVLHESKCGLTVRRLMERLERSKSTVHRDLDSLREIGIGLTAERRNGEVRYSLARWPIAAVAPTALQLAALCLAREALSMFEGTAAVEQLDQLLSQWGRLPKAQLSLKYHQRGTGSGVPLVRALDRAIEAQRRLEIVYQGERDSESKRRKIEPIALRARGEQLYLFAYDVGRNDYRVFKTARMGKATMLEEPSADHSALDLDKRFAHAVRTWTASTTTSVVVRIAAEKARFVKEYPLVEDQRLDEMSDGAVQVTANVNGITEALKWVLSWGAHAEAISPPELRAQAAAELRDAAKRYGQAKRAGTTMRKANGRSHRDADAYEQSKDVPDQVVSPELGRRGRRVAG